MAALPYIQLHIAEYLADTAHLTPTQHGAYLLLIFNYWQRAESLNNSNERLACVARMSNSEWAENRGVLAEFFEVSGDRWVHPRIERDLTQVNEKIAKKSMAGKASAKQAIIKRSTDDEQVLNTCPTNKIREDKDSKPLSNSKELELLVNSKEVDPPQEPSNKLPPCPHQEILALWQKHLPHLTQPRIWEGTRKASLKSRWIQASKPSAFNETGYATIQNGLAWWESFFAYIADTTLAKGFESDGRVWKADLEWVVRPANFQKIVDGKYDPTPQRRKS